MCDLDILGQCGKRLKLKVRKFYGLSPTFVKVTLAVINRSILLCGALFTRKLYIMKFLFLLLLFSNINL